MKDFVQVNRIRHFDKIVDRPFIEVLLKSFYLASDHGLLNHIVELIERFQNQRYEFSLYIK
jgi:inositol 1,4,5-triphosphate receptor type 3